MNKIQIPNISISNFKCFKEFSIDSFKRFNSLINSLLDGIYYQVKNNNGETIKILLLINDRIQLDNSFMPINNNFLFNNRKILSSIIDSALFNFSFLNDYSTSETRVKNETIAAFNRLQNFKIDKIVVNTLKSIIMLYKLLFSI